MSEPGSLRGRCVLVVEDEFFLADEIAKTLRELGATVVGPAPDVEGALAALAGAPRLDAAVLDVNLGGRMAWAVVDAVLARGVPVILATGYDADVIPPAYAHLPRHEKPMTAREVARAVAEMTRAEG